MKEILINEFDYPLAPERIAEHPLEERSGSKLLIYKDGQIVDESFQNLHLHLENYATLILNNTKVIEARLLFQKRTGGVIEIFCLEPYAPSEISKAMEETRSVQWRCLIGGASKWKPGDALKKELQINEKPVNLTATYLAKKEDSFIIAFEWDSHHPFAAILHAAGTIPLPPYIKRAVQSSDAERYQTVFAKHKGSVAAPTAALHFTDRVFQSLETKNINTDYITLHVGAGTFKPVKTSTIAAHVMHAENFSVTESLLCSLQNAKTIIAVGTTSLRTLESLYWLGIKLNKGIADFTLSQWEAYELEEHLTYKESLQVLHDHLKKTGEKELYCRTSLLIRPEYKFKSAKGLITNFHQPKSTLLLLVAAFIGKDWKRVYNHALTNGYRFLSYGDSSLLWRND